MDVSVPGDVSRTGVGTTTSERSNDVGTNEHAHTGGDAARISRRTVVLAPAAMALAASVPALRTRAAQERVEVSYALFVGEGATELPGWEAQAEAANTLLEPQNIQIKAQKIAAPSWSEYYQKIVAQQAAGRAPDIGRAAESLMPQIVARGQAVELTPYVSELDLSQYFESPFRSAAFRDGKHYGFPSGTYNMVLYYNKALLDEAGLAHPSTDWNNAISFQQVRDYAKQLTEGEGGNKRFGFAAGPYMAFIGMYSLSNGGQNVFAEDGSCALTQPESLAVYQWFDDMLQTDGSMPRPTDTEVISGLEMFRSSRIAMMVDGTFVHTVIRDIEEFPVGIAAVPSGTGPAFSSQFVDSWVVWKGTEHEREAWEAIKALNSPEALSALAGAGVGGTPVLRQTLEEQGDVLIGERFAAEDKAAFLGALDHGISVPYNEFYQEADDRVNSSMDEWLLGRTTAEEFAGRVCEVVTEFANK